MNLLVVPIKGRQILSPIREQIIKANNAFGWNDQQTIDDFQNEWSEYYCMMQLDKLIGYVGLHHIFDEVSINTVYIDPQYRAKKLGKELILFVLEQLKQRGVTHVFLEVRASNQAAIGLYQSSGFDLLIKRKQYYKNPLEDALIYQKKLKEEETSEQK